MKATFLLLCAGFLSGALLSSCKTTPEDEAPPPLPPLQTPTQPQYHESATPSRPETPEDFRAVTPPASYSR
jgi:hypothetical protein